MLGRVTRVHVHIWVTVFLFACMYVCVKMCVDFTCKHTASLPLCRKMQNDGSVGLLRMEDAVRRDVKHVI